MTDESSKLDSLKQKFFQVEGVSLDVLDEHPARLRKIFCSGKAESARRHPAAGRGYPFFTVNGINAEEKDRQNLEILSKW